MPRKVLKQKHLERFGKGDLVVGFFPELPNEWFTAEITAKIKWVRRSKKKERGFVVPIKNGQRHHRNGQIITLHTKRYFRPLNDDLFIAWQEDDTLELANEPGEIVLTFRKPTQAFIQ